MLRQEPKEVKGDLYDCIQIQSLLQHREMIMIRNNRDERQYWQATGARSDWQRFLDSLCFLCDSRRGGATTTSIAVEQNADSFVMWLSMNGGNTEATKSHLSEILVLLGNERSHGHTSTAYDQILQKTVARSAQRISNYANRLRSIWRELERRPGMDESKRANLSEEKAKTTLHSIVNAIEAILQKGSDHLALCHQAHVFTSADLQRVLQADDIFMDLDLYRARHYIGRLSSWHNAVSEVVSQGRRYGSVLRNCKIAVVMAPLPEEATVRVLDGGLESAIGRVLPNYRGHSLITAAVASLELAVEALPTDLEVHPHAEVTMLEHFYIHRLNFAMTDPYIACSKPSCYCCKRYLDIHPLRVRIGRYHGNLWMKWAVPRALKMLDGTTDRESLKLMRRMSDLSRDDLLSILLGRSTILQLFDSTTGFS